MSNKILEDLKKFENIPGFITHNNMELVDVNEKSVTLKVNIKEESLNPYGIVHGGLLFSLADTAMGVAARVNGRSAVTTTANITYIKQAKGEYIKAVTETIKSGKTMIHLQAKVYNDKDELVALANSTYYYID